MIKCLRESSKYVLREREVNMFCVRGDLPQSSPHQNGLSPYTPGNSFQKIIKRSKNQLFMYFFLARTL